MSSAPKPRERWSSRLGFILATSGAAVGLGNIQRFPYITAEYGGAAFVIVYLLCVVALGLPLILVEFALGRHTQKTPVAAISSIKPASWWRFAGGLGILTAFFILSYYIVVAGWTLAYALQMLTHTHVPLADFAAEPSYVIPAAAVILASTMLIVSRGLKGGVERSSKVMMPLLVVLLLGLVVRALTLPGSAAGLAFYLSPDFSKISAEAVLQALGQAFFSLCIGEAVLVTYGSYTKSDENMVASAVYIALFDTAVALLAGFMIFPALFAMGGQVEGGVGLIFNVMPQIFAEMPLGSLLGFAFFMILTFAALTTCIALLEIPVAYLAEAYKLSRQKGVWLVGAAAFALSIPAALSKGASPWLSELTLFSLPQRGFYELMDFCWGSLAMVAGGFWLTIFTGWVWGARHAADELKKGAPAFNRLAPLWSFHIKYVAPILIAAVLLALI